MVVGSIFDFEKRQLEEQTATMQVRISSYENRIARGTITFLFDKTEISFCGLDQMCMMIEEYLDRQPVFEERLGYRYIDASAVHGGWITSEEKDEMCEPFPIPMCAGSQNFAIRIHGRSNRSLQGELWVEHKKCCFRSGMELMRMMHQWMQTKCETPEIQGATIEKSRKICNI